MKTSVGQSEELLFEPELVVRGPVGPARPESYRARAGRGWLARHSFLATSGPVMRASSGKVAAMMPRAARIPPAVMK